MLDCGIRLRPAAADQHSYAEQRQRGVARLWDGKIETTVGMIYAALGGAASRRAAQASFSMQRRKAAKGRRTPVRREENTAVWLPPPLTCRRALSVIPPAWAAEVYSSNIVGYQKMNLDAGWNMIGTQFVQVGGGAKALSDAMILDSSMAGFDDEGTYANELKVWKDNNYTTYGWSGSSGTDVLEDSSLDNKWLNGDLEEVPEAELAAEDAVWIKAATAGTVLVNGEVPSEDTVTVPLSIGWNMVCNPYPGTKSVTTFGILSSDMAGFDEEGTFITEMKVWINGNYTTYGWSGSSGTDVLEDSSLDNKWLNGDLEETEGTVDYGHGVWIKAASTGSITFSAK